MQHALNAIADKYPELKEKLEKAYNANDPDEIACALKAIEKKVPNEILTSPDKELIQNAKEKLDQLEPNKGIFSFQK